MWWIIVIIDYLEVDGLFCRMIFCNKNKIPFAGKQIDKSDNKE